MTWLDDLLGSQLSVLGTLIPRRGVINLIGAAATDNPGANQTDLVLGGFDYSWQATPAPAVAANRYIKTDFSGYSSTILAAELIAPRAANITYLAGLIRGTQLATDSVIVTLMKNGAAQPLTFTIPPATATGTLLSATGAVAIAQGDLLALQLTQSGATVQLNWNPFFAIG